MAAETEDKAAPKPENTQQFEQFQAPAQEAVAQEAANKFLAELFVRPKDNSPTPQPGDNSDKFGQHGRKTAIDAVKGLQDLFKASDTGNAAGDPAQNLQKLFKLAGEGKAPTELDKLRVFGRVDSVDGEFRNVKVGDKPSGQYVEKGGNITTRIDEKNSIQYDPTSKQYFKLDEKGVRSNEPLKPDDVVGPGDKKLSDYTANGIGTESKDGINRTTYLDGRIVTENTKAQPGELQRRTTFPPGYRDDKGEALKQVDVYKQKDDGSTPATSAREQRFFENRTETRFTNAEGTGPNDKLAISKITAYKDAKPGELAVTREYREGKGPDGAKSVDVYKGDGKTPGKEIHHLADGSTRQKFGTGDKAGTIDHNDKGMPTSMQIGDKKYGIKYDEKTGRISNLTLEPVGTPPGKFELKADKDGKLQVDLEAARKAGLLSQDGKTLNLDGIPVKVDDMGKVQGDLKLNKTGDLQYKDGDGPDRKEFVRRANGNLESYDFKNWTRNIKDASGKDLGTKAWDGFNWRDIAKGPDEKGRVDFAPSKDKNAPTFIERGTAPDDKTKIGYKDGSVDADWKKGEQIIRDKTGKETGRLLYDGATYRPGNEVQSQKISDGPPPQFGFKNKDGQPIEIKDSKTGKPIPVKEGDRLTVFAEGEPRIAVKRNDGSMMIQNGDKQVEKNSKGQVTEERGPNGSTEYSYDADGDLNKFTEKDKDGKPIKTYERTGPEANPGLQSWLDREGYGSRKPNTPPPRALDKPQGYNTWKVTDQQTGQVTQERFNRLTLPTGGTQTERVGEKGPEIEVKRPTGESYRDTPTQRITDKGSGVTEILDKTNNQRTLELKEPRNGEKSIKLQANQKAEVGRDGTIQITTPADKGKPATVDRILPDGSKVSSRIDVVPPSKQGEQPRETETITSLTIAKNSGKPGETLPEIKSPPSKIEPLRGNRFRVSNDKNEPTEIYNPAQGTKQDIATGKVTSVADGKFKGFANDNGAPLLQRGTGPAADKWVVPGGRSFDPKDWKVEEGKKTPDGIEIMHQNGKDKAVIKENGTIVDYKDGKLDSLTIGGKKYTPSFEGDKITGLKGPDDKEIPVVPKDGKFTLAPDGRLLMVNKEDNGVTQTTEWFPEKGAIITRDWADDKGNAYSSSHILNSKGDLHSITLPDGTNIDIAKAKEQYKDKFSASVKDGVIDITYGDNRITVNKDGSMVEKTPAGTLNRDRFYNIVLDAAQVDKVAKLLEGGADLSKPDDQKKFLEELTNLSKLAPDDLNGMLAAVNKAINSIEKLKGTVIAVQPVNGKNSLVIKRPTDKNPVVIGLGG